TTTSGGGARSAGAAGAASARRAAHVRRRPRVSNGGDPNERRDVAARMVADLHNGPRGDQIDAYRLADESFGLPPGARFVGCLHGGHQSPSPLRRISFLILSMR